ncbi:hypothetical protein QUF58_07960, partial [Anaerolineales bacterium HSG24]|nr:hypothetical protein [Anaerolineales bacterium HSG24]
REQDLSQLSETLTGREQELSQSSETLTGKEQYLSQLSETLTGREQELSQLSETLTGKEQELSQLSETLTDKEQELSQSSETLTGREQELSQLSETLTGREQELSQLSETLTDKEQELAQQSVYVAEQTTVLETQQSELQELRQHIEVQQETLHTDKLRVEEIEANLEEKEKRLQTFDQNLQAIGKKLEQDLHAFQQEMLQARLALSKDQQQLDTERIELQQRLVELKKREEAIASEEKDLDTQSRKIEPKAEDTVPIFKSSTVSEPEESSDTTPQDTKTESTLVQLLPELEPDKTVDVATPPETKIEDADTSEVSRPPQKHKKPTGLNIFKSQQYHKWNQAILNYLLDNLPSGSPVFLTIDDETLVNIATFMNNPPPIEERVTDFIDAVRNHCVRGRHLLLGLIEPKPNNFDNTPPYLAFLGIMVLAAYRMSEDENATQTDYFTRLNELLGLSDDGRPDGLRGEVKFWEHWVSWLTHQEYVSSAKGGRGPYKYIGYPISQTLLRNSDKDFLWKHFSTRRWSKNLEDNAVLQRINRDKQYLTQHLRSALEKDDVYIAGLNQAIINEYNLWCGSDTELLANKQLSRQANMRHVTAGIYRTVDFYTAEFEYWLHPRQPRQIRTDNLSVYDGEKEHKLTPTHKGWFEEMEIMVTPTILNQGISLNFTDSSDLKQLLLPARDFWLLTPDPDDEEMGDYATWGKPELGTSFVLLCKKSLQADLNTLKQKGVIEWQDEPNEIGGNWLEYGDLMVISEEWNQISIQHEELCSSLKPQSSLSLSLRGGIRVPNGNGWLVKYGPQVVIHSVQPKAKLVLIDNRTGQTRFILDEVETNQPISIEWQSYLTGDYTLTTQIGMDEKHVNLNLVEWTELEMETVPLSLHTTSFGEGSVLGAYVSTAHQ